VQVVLLVHSTFCNSKHKHSNFWVHSCTTNWSYAFIQARNVAKSAKDNLSWFTKM